MRNTRYLALEKHIADSAASDTIQRWRYGQHLLHDSKRITPAGHLKQGVLAELIGIAAQCGVKLLEREIQWRLKCARTYSTETEIRTASSEFGDWTGLRNAGFPPVEVADPGEPYDPRSVTEKLGDLGDEQKRRKKDQEQPALPGLSRLELPNIFSHETHGPRTPVRSLLTEAETDVQLAKNFGKLADEKLTYATQLAGATGGNLDMSWYEAEARRLGLKALGLSSWDEFHEVTRDFLGPRGADPGLYDPDADEE